MLKIKRLLEINKENILSSTCHRIYGESDNIYIYMCVCVCVCVYKAIGKVIPLQARCGPEGG